MSQPLLGELRQEEEEGGRRKREEEGRKEYKKLWLPFFAYMPPSIYHSSSCLSTLLIYTPRTACFCYYLNITSYCLATSSICALPTYAVTLVLSQRLYREIWRLPASGIIPIHVVYLVHAG